MININYPIKTDYVDIYRIKDSVILYVYKYKVVGKYIYGLNSKNTKLYISGIGEFKIATKNITEKYPVGTVFHYDYPLAIVEPSKYRYIIKTSGDAFSGDSQKFDSIIEEITKIKKKYEEN